MRYYFGAGILKMSRDMFTMQRGRNTQDEVHDVGMKYLLCQRGQNIQDEAREVQAAHEYSR